MRSIKDYKREIGGNLLKQVHKSADCAIVYNSSDSLHTAEHQTNTRRKKPRRKRDASMANKLTAASQQTFLHRVGGF
ncbi:hypothetical protein DMENIID0001_141210 [Sergentomyia squamirostris]